MVNTFFNPFNTGASGSGASGQAVQAQGAGAQVDPAQLNQQLGQLYQLFSQLSGGQTDGFSYANNQSGAPQLGQQYGTGPLPTPQGNGQPQISATLVETGTYEKSGTVDTHSQQVAQAFRSVSPDAPAYWEDVFETEAPQGQDGASDPEPASVKKKDDLNQFIDGRSTDALNLMSEEITENVNNYPNQRVINGSLGYSRSTVYEDTYNQLKGNQELGKELGISSGDMNDDEKLRAAVTRYVDTRMDAQGSAYSKALQNYQGVTQNAAERGFTVVVATGNSHEQAQDFKTGKQGSELNFLAQSDNVISVAASEDNINGGTASFSSRGDGRFNPTLSADGTDLQFQGGTNSGTSFSAPQVTGTIVNMLNANPNLSFQQIKSILQQSATNTRSSSKAEGAGILNSQSALDWARYMAGNQGGRFPGMTPQVA